MYICVYILLDYVLCLFVPRLGALNTENLKSKGQRLAAPRLWQGKKMKAHETQDATRMQKSAFVALQSCIIKNQDAASETRMQESCVLGCSPCILSRILQIYPLFFFFFFLLGTAASYSCILVPPGHQDANQDADLCIL